MLVLRGLEAMGVDNHEPMRAASRGVAAHGAESRRRLGREPAGPTTIPRHAASATSTASQTAWAVLGLLAAGDTRSDSVARGIAYLLRTQKKDGSWDETFYTGTGLPARLLPEVSHVPPILPADRVDDVREGDEGSSILALTG